MKYGTLIAILSLPSIALAQPAADSALAPQPAAAPDPATAAQPMPAAMPQNPPTRATFVATSEQPWDV
jgi:hypothetical protein